MEDDPFTVEVGLELVTRLEVSGEELAGERIDHELLERTLERTCAVHRIVPSFGHAGDCPVSEVKRDLPFRQQLVEPVELDADDLSQLRLPEGLEEDDLVDPVQELGPERRRQLAQRELLDLIAVVAIELE